MENFFCEDNFLTDLGQLIEHLEFEDQDIKELEEDWSTKIELSNLEPIFEVTAEKMLDMFLDANEDRLGEDLDDKDDNRNKLIKLFEESCDFEKLNKGIPEMYYPSNQFEVVTKKDLIEYCNLK